jgi:hypothetical protein
VDFRPLGVEIDSGKEYKNKRLVAQERTLCASVQEVMMWVYPVNERLKFQMK